METSNTRYDDEGVTALLLEARDRGASYIHLKVPGPPRFRIGGQLTRSSFPPIAPADMERIASSLLKRGRREGDLAHCSEIEFAFGIPEVGRYRAHIYKQRCSIGVVLRAISMEMPTLEELGIAQASGILKGPPGLVLVRGGTGRMRVLAALLDDYNRTVEGHVVALCDPLEVLHDDLEAFISQREISVDTPDYVKGMRAALHQDPDVLAIGDVPNAQVAELALQIAESGCFVVGCVSDSGSLDVSHWFVRIFPPHREREVSSRTKDLLRGVLTERLGSVSLWVPASR
ncbi:MAG: ATPase, T2SS/T4P/T4SS family [Myxococcota bacterium]|jgi:twitching motility protein PilT|nr:ATPase, T2SS/T4P/T4SS family [Myxococcota bacterium]